MNANIPPQFGGVWSHKELTGHCGIPFDDLTDFAAYMQMFPFIIILGSFERRYPLAAAVLKRTFSFSLGNLSPSRARYGDAGYDMTLTRGMDGPIVLQELIDYTTYVINDIHLIDGKDYPSFRRVLWGRKDMGKYTIMTASSSTALAALPGHCTELLKPLARTIVIP